MNGKSKFDSGCGYNRAWYRKQHCISVASFTKEVNWRLAKRPLVFNGRLANRQLNSLVKEATGDPTRAKVWYGTLNSSPLGYIWGVVEVRLRRTLSYYQLPHYRHKATYLCFWCFMLTCELPVVCLHHTSVSIFWSSRSSITMRNWVESYTYILSTGHLNPCWGNWSSVYDHSPPCRHALVISNLSPLIVGISPINGVFALLMGEWGSLLYLSHISVYRTHFSRKGEGDFVMI